MTIGFNNLFGQRDVRETATDNTSNALQYWKAAGIHAIKAPSSGSWTYLVSSGIFNGRLTSGAANQYAIMPVRLPNGAIATYCKVHGNGSNSWHFSKVNSGGGGGTDIATDVMDASEPLVEVIDNTNYSYYVTIELDSGDDLDMVELRYYLA